MIITTKENKPRKVKERGTTTLDGVVSVTPVSTIHTEIYVNDAPLETPSPGKPSLDQVTFEPEK